MSSRTVVDVINECREGNNASDYGQLASAINYYIATEVTTLCGQQANCEWCDGLAIACADCIKRLQESASRAMAEKAAQHDEQTTFGEYVAAMIDKLLSDKYTNSHKIVAGIIDQELRRSLAGAES
jgi:hypothetical protein